MNQVINVTKPFLPPKSDYFDVVDKIWENEWLTNNGPVLRDFEDGLMKYLRIQDLLVLANGTLGLQIAFKALGLKPGDEILTTPFSYVATTSSIVWEGLLPVYVDIDNDTFNIDPASMEKSITKKTKAILATHVFGNACDIDAINRIAKKHRLSVIYDAAHCFGVQYKGRSILLFGDVSMLSLHATKLFHSVEGGVLVSRHSELIRKGRYYRNFGHDGYYKFNGVGINAKNSEFHAAMGLVNLPYADEILARRKSQWLHYYEALKEKGFRFQELNRNCAYNYSYFPVVFEEEKNMLDKLTLLQKSNIFCRRYFYPPLSHLDYVQGGDLPVAENLSKKILCLPLYHDMDQNVQDRVIDILS